MPKRAFVALRKDEIESLYHDFDVDSDGSVSLSELERKLKEVLDEIAPNPLRHHLTHPQRASSSKATTTNEKAKKHDAQSSKKDEKKHTHDSDLHDFLCKLMPGCSESMSQDEFFAQVSSWNIPSQDQTLSDNDNDDAKDYDRKLPFSRRFAAWWSVKGPEVAFLVFVGALIVGFSLWQGLIYATNGQARAALGGGVVAAKFSAGAVYPTFFFLILSMSRWFATFCRKSYIVSRFINWDLSQSFHIKMSCAALLFSCTHVIGHLTGTFVYGSSANRQENIREYFGDSYVRRSYSDYIATRPGWTGLTALSSFLIIAATSVPWFRKRFYEAFQAAHLLMYLMFAMLAMHGTAKLRKCRIYQSSLSYLKFCFAVQHPMLGYWLAFPVICVLLERAHRLYLTFFGHHSARMEALDDGTVVITAEKPEGQTWKARAGQYILLQVPSVSRFQWHPFTISTCIGGRLQIHIKADGNWTNKLHELASSAKESSGSQEKDYCRIKVGIDGPFGAPAQRFYSFDKSIIVGAGIGVTPFSACLTDLEENFKSRGDPWKLTRTRSFGPTRSRTLGGTPQRSRRPSSDNLTATAETPSSGSEPGHGRVKLEDDKRVDPGSYGIRRCDFHWSVREKNDLLWFSDLLNRAAHLAEGNQHLTLNIRAHITAKKKKLSVHVFRYLLDRYRTEDFPYSALTGLRIRSDFGRPDFEQILDEFYDDMKAQGWHGRVGVFHCGPPVVGEMLADLCSQLTARAAQDGTGMRFLFHNEVFG